jgi:adenylate kinase family enzyme
MELLTNVFIGRSGCGKGTQVARLDQYIKSKDGNEIFHLEAGDRFREFIKEKYHASELAKEISDRGGLQPEFLSVWAWAGELIKGINHDQHLFIDGTPRRLMEARVLESAFEFFDRKKVNIIYINVSREWATEKLQARGRADDKELCDINARLDWFEENVVPVIDFYRAHKSHIFHEINGEQSIDEVHADIVKSLGI